MNAGRLYLAIDQGGHASRALVFDPNGQLQAGAEAPIETLRPAKDRVEHDPEALIQSVRQALERVVADPALRDRPIAAAGLATQRSTIVCFDRETGRALAPVISWQDTRNAAWLGSQALDPEHIHSITGLVISPHYGAGKMRWCLDHVPAVAAAAQNGRLGLAPLASYLIYRLLAERRYRVDPANASRTLLWDVEQGDWSPELLQAFGISRDCLPRCVPSRHRFGTLEAAGWQIPLTVVTGDQSAALFAHGMPGAGDLMINIGTGAFLQRVVDHAITAPRRLLQSVVWQDQSRRVRVLEGTVNGAGGALSWLAEELGTLPQALWSGAGQWLAEITDPPLFINAVGGLASPFWVAGLESRFHDGSDVIQPGDTARCTVAVLESIVFLLKANIEAISACGRPARIIVSGGLSALDGLCQRLADLSQLAVERPHDAEATARGLAWLVSGAQRTWSAAGSDGFQPGNNPALTDRYRRWRALLDKRLSIVSQ